MEKKNSLIKIKFKIVVNLTANKNDYKIALFLKCEPNLRKNISKLYDLFDIVIINRNRLLIVDRDIALIFALSSIFLEDVFGYNYK
ncbi:MAG: hypothetical protein ACFFAO_22065 [Candidatus Hermodarchaeota archaeon]